MRKVTLTLTAAALALGATTMVASAQTQLKGAESLNSLKNATPVIVRVNCNGRTGEHGCGPGFVWNGNRCVRC